jgi:hypothetical protein
MGGGSNPFEEARLLQIQAAQEGVDPFEILNREPPAEGPENPFLGEKGEPYHDRPEEEDCE